MQISLGMTIRNRRLELGLTQEQLAERISTGGEYIRQSEISRIESGAVGLPRRARLERIALALDVPLGELLARSGWTNADVYLPPSAPVAVHTETSSAASAIDTEQTPFGAWQRPEASGTPFVTSHQASEATDDHTATPRRLSTLEDIRARREALSLAMRALEEEKERLRRNRRAAHDMEARYSRREARDSA
jgi:transcriptional regulator with XRE-family HTH domain